MKKSTLTTLTAACTLMSANALADEHQGTTVTRAKDNAIFEGPEAYFTGKASVEMLFPAADDIHASAAYVTFEPGARSAWHTHPAGQRLVVTDGVGLTQEWGKAVQEIHPGDVVICPPGVKHWHGARPDQPMTHLAITGDLDGKNVTWMEKVTDEEYSSQ